MLVLMVTVVMIQREEQPHHHRTIHRRRPWRASRRRESLMSIYINHSPPSLALYTQHNKKRQASIKQQQLARILQISSSPKRKKTCSIPLQTQPLAVLH
tara:strand:- start:9935 stop:10231 length:297 start_codon:yes stop_codon:yes gene_type:complete